MRHFVYILFLFTSSLFAQAPLAISVDAGNPVTLCYGESLAISDLNASISGDVDDGIWFTMGDGIFLPSQENNGIFSITTTYQPGPQDLSSGSFTLILVSDDPDGNGPMVEVSDMVQINFMTAPALVCNNNLNVSLAEGCQQAVDITMLVANPTPPLNKYEITLTLNGQVIENNILLAEHIGQTINFSVGHQCTSNTCSGSLTVSDYIPPFLTCNDLTVSCEYGALPDSTNLPIPFYATATEIDSVTYEVSDFDACGLVTLTYSDNTEELICSTGYIMSIERTWYAEDESGNQSTCQQTILVEPLPLDSVNLPPHYNNIVESALECGGDWIALDNGYPSPESTGFPSYNMCQNLESTYNDIYFEECGGGFKIVRNWFIIDWCTTNNISYNQIIKVLDSTPPAF